VVQHITAQLLDSHKIPVFIWFYLFVYVFVCFDLNMAQIWHKKLLSTEPFFESSYYLD